MMYQVFGGSLAKKFFWRICTYFITLHPESLTKNKEYEKDFIYVIYAVF